ncbi:MAG: flagellar hook-basal body complex protein [Planctomycetota bacterium]
MASTSSLFIGLTGLNANARAIDVVGNNIANVNTTGFKSVRLNFSNQLSRTIREGSPPDANTGGTNPTQIGQGVSIAGTTRNFQPGARSGTGDARDLAIDGDGLFVVERNDERFYTRVGAFRPDSDNALTTVEGDRVLGYPVDQNFQIQEGPLSPIEIPIGTLTIAEPTRNVNLGGNLNADGDTATSGTTISLTDAAGGGFGLLPTATVAATPPNVLEPGSLLTEIEDPAVAGAPLFSAGQQIQLRNAERGTTVIPTSTLQIDATTTVADYLLFLNSALEIDPTQTNPDGLGQGARIDPTTGVISIVGRPGTENALTIDAQDLRVLNAAGDFVAQPFTTAETAAANGESIRTSFLVYDSLGTPLTVDMTFSLAEKTATGTTWTYVAESTDDTLGSRVVGTGEVRFDTDGRVIGPTTFPLTLDRAGTGAAAPLTFDVNIAADGDEITALTDTSSQLFSLSQDGSPIGTLASYSVAPDGRVTGAFTNQLVRTIAQVVTATFTAPEGLVEVQDNLYRPGPNSGDAIIAEPGSLGTGRVVSGALELSNVELGDEFINLILASTGYSASSRVIRTSDELIQELLSLVR